MSDDSLIFQLILVTAFPHDSSRSSDFSLSILVFLETMFREAFLNKLNIRLERLEECLRRCDEVKVRFRNEMLLLHQCLKQKVR